MLQPEGQIHFFTEEISFQLKQRRAINAWIQKVFKAHKSNFNTINFIFCSDEYLLEINRTHLNHDYYTDIITFPLWEKDEDISADIFISIDRVKDNAKSLSLSFRDELHRVIIHGVLHVLGFKDKRKADALIMRKMENKMLSLRSF